jgi:hypothetical protein
MSESRTRPDRGPRTATARRGRPTASGERGVLRVASAGANTDSDVRIGGVGRARALANPAKVDTALALLYRRGMRLRSIAVRLVLIVAALTTVATSAIPDIVLSATTEGPLGAGTRRISVFANRAAVNHADFIELEIGPVDSSSAVSFDTPDPALPIVLDSLHPTKGFSFDVEALCARDRDCDASLTFEVPVDEYGPPAVSVTVTFERATDSRFFFPDNPPFPEDAAVEVRIEP